LPFEPGNWYGLPSHVDTRAIVYRKDLFEDPANRAEFYNTYGYELRPPKTTTEWLQIAKFFTRDTDGDGNVDQWGTGVTQRTGAPAHAWLLLNIWTFGAEVTTPDYQSSALDDARVVEALKWSKEMLKYNPEAAMTWEFYQEIAPLAGGQLATAPIYDSWYANLFDPSVVTKPELRGQFGISVLPAYPLNARGYTTGKFQASGGIINMSAHSRNKEATWEFMKWLLGKKQMSRVLKERGVAAMSRKSIWEDPNVATYHPSFTDEYIRVHLDSVANVNRASIKVPGLSAILEMLGQVYPDVMLGSTTPEDATEHMHAEVNRILKEYASE